MLHLFQRFDTLFLKIVHILGIKIGSGTLRRAHLLPNTMIKYIPAITPAVRVMI